MMLPNPRVCRSCLALLAFVVPVCYPLFAHAGPDIKAAAIGSGEDGNQGAQPDDANNSTETVRIPADGYQWLTYLLTTPNWRGGGQRLVSGWGEWDKGDNSNRRRLASIRTVLVLGDTTGLEFPGLEEFVRDGGTLVVASDQKLWVGREAMGNALIHLMGNGAFITGEKLRAIGRDAGYQGQSRLIPLELEGASPLFRGRGGLVSPVISNSPSRVAGPEGRAVVHARFQGTVELMPSGPRMGGAIFALGTGRQDASTGEGRVLLLADPEVVCNQMLTVPGNLAFACNLAEWMTTGDQSGGQPRRDQMLLIVNGQVVDKPFVPPMPMPDIPLPNFPPEDLLSLLYRLAEGGVQAGEGILAKMEDENIPDRAGAAIFRFLWPGPILVLVACGVGLWLFLVLTGRTLNQDMADLKR